MSRTIHHTPNYSEGNFNLSYHLEMVSDHERVATAKASIDHYLKPDSIFCELGCGTGIFTIHAAKHCQKVYAVERDAAILEVARKNIERNGLTDKIDLIHADAAHVQLPEKADIIFCEMLSIWMINEPQVEVMNNALLRNLKEGGKVLPEKVVNLAALGNICYLFEGVEMKASFAEFTGIRAPAIATESKVVNTIDFSVVNQVGMKGSVTFQCFVSERLNCVRLMSAIQFAPQITFHSTDSLMPVTTVPLRNELDVEAGDHVVLEYDYKHRTSVDEASFTVRKLA